jgi:hypothetical protein
MQFAVGFKFEGKTGHVVVDAEEEPPTNASATRKC